MGPESADDAAVSELIHEYAAAATEAGRLDIPSRQQNKAARRVSAIYGDLRERGRAAQGALLPLLDHPDPAVRLWAASHALEFAPDRAVATLKAMKGVEFPRGLSAEMTLREWRAGRLRFP
jgi:hypothetical protein